MTLADHRASRMIADPYRLYDCSLETDGAAAVILTTIDRSRDGANVPIELAGFGEGHPDSPDDLVNRPSLLASGVGAAAKWALTMAGIAIDDVDAAMLYDPFTAQVLIQLEEIGYCAPGEAGPRVAAGETSLGGRMPVNTHGGLLSEGHMSGLNHVLEAVRQLRGSCGERQVVDAAHVLVTGWGDLGDGTASVLRRAS
jgi:acetyl-CoA acetyltransferase